MVLKIEYKEISEKLFEASKLNNLDSIKDVLSPYYHYFVDLYENDLLLIDDDYRSGIDTYGYEAIQENLSYIWDRWKCSFRVRWLIDLINPQYCLWDGSIKKEKNA